MLQRSFFGSSLLSLAGPSVLSGPLVCTTSVEVPMARAVDPLHPLTDFPGIAVGDIEGNRFMGFGFPDQTLIWDGFALQNTTGPMLEEQSPPLPMRTLESLAVSTAAWRPPRPSRSCQMRPRTITSPA